MELIKSAFSQLVLVMILSSIFYAFHWLRCRKRGSDSFLEYLGIGFDKDQLDKTFFIISGVLILYAILSTIAQFYYMGSMKSMMTGDNSPYGKILKDGFSYTSLLLGFIYCFVQASASEELLFRGLIGKRLIYFFGNFIGNILQALVFWVMHLLIFKLVTGEWFNNIQVLGFFTSFSLGLLCGYSNFRKEGNTIFPSFILHAVTNFSVFITLGFLIS